MNNATLESLTIETIDERVRKVIAETFRLSHEAAQSDLRMGNPSNWDSLGHIELVLEIEKEFGILFPNFVIAELVSAPAIVRAIEEITSR
jgi:acyl carrier protein